VPLVLGCSGPRGERPGQRRPLFAETGGLIRPESLKLAEHAERGRESCPSRSGGSPGFVVAVASRQGLPNGGNGLTQAVFFTNRRCAPHRPQGASAERSTLGRGCLQALAGRRRPRALGLLPGPAWAAARCALAIGGEVVPQSQRAVARPAGVYRRLSSLQRVELLSVLHNWLEAQKLALAGPRDAS